MSDSRNQPRNPATTAATTVVAVVAGCLLLLLPAGGASALPGYGGGVPVGEGSATVAPPELKASRVDEKLNGDLRALRAAFTDDRGRTVRLADYFADGRKPVVLQLAYYECPQLCKLVWNGLVEATRGTNLTIGKDFDVVIVSIDPREKPALAAAKKRSLVDAGGKPEEADGWHLLTGDEASIRELADAVGFRYAYVERIDQFAHPAVLMVLTPDGRTSRYLYGTSFDPRTLRLSLVEASEGKIGTTLDKIVLMTCLQFDGTGYALAALKVMRAGGVLTVLVLGAAVTTLFIKESRRARQAAAAAAAAAAGDEQQRQA